MEHKKIYYHHYAGINTILATFTGSGIIMINNCIVILNSNSKTYRIEGGNFPSNISIYLDSNNVFYFIKNDNVVSYINIEELQRNNMSKGLFHGYGQSFTLTDDYIKVNRERMEYNIPMQCFQTKTYISKDVTTDFISLLPKNANYSIETSLLIISMRQGNGTTYSSISMLYRKHEGDNNLVFTLIPISEQGNAGNFNITPTNTGFTFQGNGSNYNYSIIEIAASTLL